MAAAQKIYEENDNVDENLLNQISKHVFHDNLESLARDLGIKETEIRKITRIPSPQDQIFKVSMKVTQHISIISELSFFTCD